ncbi:hypothetical protein OH786_31955 [Streptomyces atratus]|uniref:Uncharacterized protein n=1 Tax=Streptomyces atratus TaxID=1893 RepID=A0A1K2F5K7_STRAR|nr:hypothetical protein [Streptomyces atratus]SFY42810.1 hypothetical protein SAMN02787144_103217 [Streptomyces atratus]
MKNDQRLSGRRALLRLAAGLGAAAAVHMIAAVPAGEQLRRYLPELLDEGYRITVPQRR